MLKGIVKMGLRKKRKRVKIGLVPPITLTGCLKVVIGNITTKVKLVCLNTTVHGAKQIGTPKRNTRSLIVNTSQNSN